MPKQARPAHKRSIIATSFFKVYGKYLVSGAVVLLIWLYWNHLTQTIEDQKNSMDTLRQQLAVEQALHESNVLKLKLDIDDQNRLISTLNKDYRQIERELEEALRINNTEHNDADQQFNNTLDDIEQLEQVQSCQQAFDILIDFAPTLGWQGENAQ